MPTPKIGPPTSLGQSNLAHDVLMTDVIPVGRSIYIVATTFNKLVATLLISQSWGYRSEWRQVRMVTNKTATDPKQRQPKYKQGVSQNGNNHWSK